MKKFVLIFLILMCFLSSLSGMIYSRQFYGNLRLKAIKLIGGKRDDSTINNFQEFIFGYYFQQQFALQIRAGYGSVRIRDKEVLWEIQSHFQSKTDSLQTNLLPINFGFRYNFLRNKTFIPFIEAGLGILDWQLENHNIGKKISDKNFTAHVSSGTEWLISRYFGINLVCEYQHFFAQKKDMSGLGDAQTGSLSFGLGFSFRFAFSKDSDKDGIPDKIDRCPFQAEDYDTGKITMAVPIWIMMAISYPILWKPQLENSSINLIRELIRII